MAHQRQKKEPPASTATAQLQKLLQLLRPANLFLLGLLVCWSMLQPLDSTSVFDGSALPQNLGFLVLSVGVSLDQLLNRRSSPLNRIETCCLVGLGLWLLIVTWHAGDLANPRTGWNGFWHLLGIFSLYYALRSLLVSPQLRSTVVLILIGGSVLMAVMGSYQVAIDFPRERSEYRADPDRKIAQLGIEAPAGSSMRQRLENRLFSPEPLATFSLANSLAVFLSSGLVLLIGSLGFGLVSRSALAKSGPAPTTQRFSTALAIAIILLIGIVWMLTRSRIAFLTLPIALMLLVLGAYWQFASQIGSRLEPNTKGWIKRIVIGLVLCVIAGGGWMWIRDPLVFTEATKSLSYRLDYWLATLSMIQDHALLGIGLGNFQAIYPKYMLPTASETIADPHNWILDIASTCSPLFAIAILICLAAMLLRKPRAIACEPDCQSPGTRPLFLGATVGGLIVLFGLMLFGLDDRTAMVLFTSMVLATALVYGVRTTVQRFIVQSTLGPTVAAIAMLCCLLVSGSWQAPGLLVPLVCFLAISQVNRSAASSDSDPKWLANFPMVLSLLVLIGFLWQSWSPVLNSTALANSAFSATRGQLELIEQARRIDPLNSQWDRFRAQIQVETALATKDTATFESNCQSAVSAIDYWARRESNSFLTGQFAGDRILQLIESATERNLDPIQLRQQAAEYYAKAVEARPNSALLRTQLAYTLLMVGETSAAESEIAEAQKISDNTPHEDQKLTAQLIWLPGAPAELSSQMSSPPYCRAELVVKWIRSQLSP